jgi:structural maintenance of chromosome 4
MMKPKSGDADKPGLLEYLEDIIGSNQYQSLIDELSSECEKLDQAKLEKG